MKKITIVILLVSLGYILALYISPKANKNQVQTVVQEHKEECPYFVDQAFPAEYIKSNRFGEVTIQQPPVLLKDTRDVEVINKEFKPYIPPENESFYTIPDGSYPWAEVGSYDVDKDGNKEKIITANTAMNHTPHLIKILKNNRVIFEAEGANIAISEVNDHNGFFLEKTLDWIEWHSQIIRYINNNQKFIPVWQQDICGVYPYEDKIK